ncbi:MAG: hypothetical protein ACKVOM_03280 [Ferruginibacter sp.]
MHFRIGFVFLLLNYTTTVNAQGWAKGKNEGYFNLAQSFIQSSEFYSPEGKVINIRTTGLYATSFYGEYGITSKLTAVANVPFYVRNTFTKIQYIQSGRSVPADELNSLGDIELGFKYGFFQKKPIVLAVTFLAGIPSGNNAGGDSKILQTGDGEFNQLLRVDASHSFYPRPFYVSVYSAFNNRTSGFSDEYRYGFDFGYTGKKFNAIFHLNSIMTLNNGKTTGANVNNGIFSNNLEMVLPSIELAYDVYKNFGVSVAAGYPISGQNLLNSASYKGAIYYKLKKR